MKMVEKEREKPGIKIGPNLLDLLSQFHEIELEDAELEIGDLEISLEPSFTVPNDMFPKIPTVLEKAKPTALLDAEFKIPVGEYPGKVVEVKLLALKEGAS